MRKPISDELISQKTDETVDKWFDELPISNIDILNERLAKLHPRDILLWAAVTFPKLHQTTSFGITGCVIIDMISKLNIQQPPIIFIDTLHHFTETLSLCDQVKNRYNVAIDVYYPSNVKTRDEFNNVYGLNLWQSDPEKYDFITKVEPAKRAYVGVTAVITGRRRSQMGDRSNLKIIEKPSAGPIKINPLAYWNYHQVWIHVVNHNVPYNPLIDKGYKSVGDFHSTVPVEENEGERDGRWKGCDKTECGLHTRLH
jgi:phosphoadenosine phosphosulfate reductase